MGTVLVQFLSRQPGLELVGVFCRTITEATPLPICLTKTIVRYPPVSDARGDQVKNYRLRKAKLKGDEGLRDKLMDSLLDNFQKDMKEYGAGDQLVRSCCPFRPVTLQRPCEEVLLELVRV